MASLENWFLEKTKKRRDERKYRDELTPIERHNAARQVEREEQAFAVRQAKREREYYKGVEEVIARRQREGEGERHTLDMMSIAGQLTDKKKKQIGLREKLQRPPTLTWGAAVKETGPEDLLNVKIMVKRERGSLRKMMVQ